VLYNQGKYPEALDCCNQALAFNSKNDLALSNKGRVLKALGQSDEALVCFDQALALNPKNNYALEGKGLVSSPYGL
jgi:tetratricopeptide (TPR) repeat protein